MKLIYSSFDTIIFAVKGAATPKTLDYLSLAKEGAVKENRDMPVTFDNGGLKGLIAPTGAKGGYAYVLKIGGDFGHVISLKKNLGRDEWNGLVKIRALALATFGWEGALERVFCDFKRFGFSEHGISLNRVDYAMDFLNADIALNPTHFVAHARVTKAVHNLKIGAYSRGDCWESVTLGKMRNRQIIVYDKRREAIAKRKLEWFEIWKLDPKDITQTVHRVEVRLGKNECLKSEIRTFDDFRAYVNAAMTRAVNVIRYAEPVGQNRSRWPNHPLWDAVQSHVQEHLLKNPNYVEPSRVKQVMRAQKALESKKQVLGNMAGLSVFEDMDKVHIKDEMIKFLQGELSEIEANNEHSFWKSRAKTQDRFSFL